MSLAPPRGVKKAFFSPKNTLGVPMLHRDRLKSVKPERIPSFRGKKGELTHLGNSGKKLLLFPKAGSFFAHFSHKNSRGKIRYKLRLALKRSANWRRVEVC